MEPVDRRRLYLDKAFELFSQLGFTGVSVAPADIAAIRAAVMPQKA